MEEEKFTEGNFGWNIKEFTSLASTKHHSDKFIFGGCEWNMLLYPDHTSSGQFKVFIEGTDLETLPAGMKKEIDCIVAVMNQKDGAHLVRSGRPSTDQQVAHRYFSIFDLKELCDLSNGYLVNDTLILEAEVRLHTKVDPQPSTATGQVSDLGSCIASLEEFVKNCSVADGDTWFLKNVSSKEVNNAKMFLKKKSPGIYLSDEFLTNLVNLSMATSGLSPEQKDAVDSFLANYESLIRDVHSCEEDRVNFLLERLGAERAFSAVKKCHEKLIQLEEKMKSPKEKAVLDWKALMTESEKAEAECADRARRLEVAEKRLKNATERMSRTEARLSELKAHFA